ncbi:MAG: glutathione S-transferase family protein [Pseudomonadota bacterium]
MQEIFYDCATAPSPKRVRMFLAEKGLQPEVRQVDLGTGEHFGDEFLAVNPMAMVPVLKLPDGRAIAESNAICWYLEETYPTPPLLGADPAERALTFSLSQQIEFYLIGAVAESFRNFSKAFPNRAMPGPFKAEQVPALVERGRSRAEQYIAYLNKLLSSRKFVAGDQYSMADITAYIGISFAGRIKIAVPEEYSALHDWFERIDDRPSAQL